MEILGHIGDRQIIYCNLRSEADWFKQIHFRDWIAFTIVDNTDRDLLDDLVTRCLDNGICYVCCAGELASLTEDYFDEEIVWREVKESEETGSEQDYEDTPLTSFDSNLDEGFWFAATTANQIINDEYVISHQVVCIDCTNNNRRNHLLDLVKKINNGWLPPDSD